MAKKTSDEPLIYEVTINLPTTLGVLILCGLWLILSSIILPHESKLLLFNDLIIGFIALVISVVERMDWFNKKIGNIIIAGLGVWLIVSPFLFHSGVTFVRSNDIVLGFILITLSMHRGGILLPTQSSK